MKKVFVLLLSMQVATVCQGAPVYEWKDDRGVLHFTDDPKKVPQRYENRVRKRDLGPSEEKQKNVTPPVQTIPSESSPPVQQAPAVPPSGVQALPDEYGGHPARWWRDRFAVLRSQMAALQGGLSAKEQRLDDLRRRHLIFQRPSDRVAANDLAAEINRDENQIKEIQGALANLQMDADRAGVPAEWR